MTRGGSRWRWLEDRSAQRWTSPQASTAFAARSSAVRETDLASSAREDRTGRRPRERSWFRLEQVGNLRTRTRRDSDPNSRFTHRLSAAKASESSDRISTHAGCVALPCGGCESCPPRIWSSQGLDVMTRTPREEPRPLPPQRLALMSDAAAISELMRASVLQLFPRFYDPRQTASAVVHIAHLDGSSSTTARTSSMRRMTRSSPAAAGAGATSSIQVLVRGAMTSVC